MEYFVLYSYIKFKNIKLKEVIKNIKKSQLILFGIMFVSLIVTIAICQIPHYSKFSLLSLFVEFVCFAFFSIKQDRISLEESDDMIKKQDKKYDDVKDWLENIGFDQKNQIKQLCKRCEKIADGLKEQKRLEQKKIDKVFAVLIVPFCLLLISWSFQQNGEPIDTIVLAAEVAVALGAIYIFVMVVLDMLFALTYYRELNMNSLVHDLHGVLDRCFIIEENDIV